LISFVIKNKKNMALKPGDKSPIFSSQDQDGIVVSNKSLLGKKYILFFYGQDDTPTCTKQVCATNDVFDILSDQGYDVYGVSPDKVAKHQKFIAKYNLDINLLSDPDKTMMFAFEAYGPKMFMGKEVIGVYRKAYLIDEKGKIIHIIHEVNAAKQGEQLLAIFS
jgi:thioredoxin-dependent peroxiredoxin